MGLSPTYPVALGAWWHHQDFPKGLHSSSWDLAGMRAGHSLSSWLPKPFPFPRHCGEKVTWLDTCLCQGRTQPDCCCDPWREVILLAGSPQESSQSVTGSLSQAGRALMPVLPTLNESDLQSPLPPLRVTCKEKHSPLLSPAPGHWHWPTAAPGSWITLLESAVKPGRRQPKQGNPSASHKKGPRQQKKEASQACLIALLLL